MRPDELVTAVTGTLAATSFVADHLWGLARRPDADGRRPPANPLVIVSAVGILALVVILLLSVLLDWPSWLIRDAMGVLATVVFPFAQIRMHYLRRVEERKRST
jgi:hypothetical protein